MKTGRPKYKREQIQNALLKLKSGQSLTDVAKELGASKSTVSYWISRESSFLPEENLRHKTISDYQQRFAHVSWDNLFKVSKRITHRLDEATFSELVRLLESLSEIIGRMTPTVQLQLKADVGPTAEDYQETKKEVEAYLAKQRANNDLSAPPVEQNKPDQSAEKDLDRIS